MAFTHQCATHNVDLNMQFVADVFGPADTDVVVGSHHMESSCSASAGCGVQVTRDQPFGIMLNDAFDGTYTYTAEWTRV